MDALEYLGAVREEFSNLPFVLFTGKGSVAIAAEAIPAGATDDIQPQSNQQTTSVGLDRYTVILLAIGTPMLPRGSRSPISQVSPSSPDCSRLGVVRPRPTVMPRWGTDP